MTAKQKIEGLTRSWYGYSLFAAILSVLSFSASGLFALAFGLGVSIALNAVALVFSIAVVAFLGRKLVTRSSATRTFLVVVSALFSALGALATLEGVWTFFGAWSIASACSIVMAACCTMLNVRSFRVLTETSVRAYFV
jgi:hypothetical protein